MFGLKLVKWGIDWAARLSILWLGPWWLFSYLLQTPAVDHWYRCLLWKSSSLLSSGVSYLVVCIMPFFIRSLNNCPLISNHDCIPWLYFWFLWGMILYRQIFLIKTALLFTFLHSMRLSMIFQFHCHCHPHHGSHPNYWHLHFRTIIPSLPIYSFEQNSLRAWEIQKSLVRNTMEMIYCINA